MDSEKEDADEAKQHILSGGTSQIVAWHEVPGKAPLERTVL
jgi:hypothetical protein